MKTVFSLLAILLFAQTTFASSFSCDAQTEEHVSLSFSNNQHGRLDIKIEENDGSVASFKADLESSIEKQLTNSLLKQPAVIIGQSANTIVASDYSFYSDAISLVVMQKVEGLQGALTVYLTRNNSVSVYTCQ